jgi:hypothetical protein
MPWISKLDAPKTYETIRTLQRDGRTRAEIVSALAESGIKISIRGLNYFISARARGKARRVPMLLPPLPPEPAPISSPAQHAASVRPKSNLFAQLSASAGEDENLFAPPTTSKK